MSISIVIVNKDDRGVERTLEALEREDCSLASEVVVVDASEGRLSDIRDRFPRVTWIEFRPRADKPTIAEQRNVGVARSGGETVVFIDAGCVPDPGWLPTLIDPIARQEELIVAGSYRSARGRSIHDEDRHFAGTGPYLEQASTLNLAIRRSVFEHIGGFDESFAYGSDVDFTWRAVDSSYRIRYVPEAQVTHDWGPVDADLRRSFRYGQAAYRLYAKHPRRRRGLWRQDPVSIAYPLFLIVSPLSLVMPWIPVLLAIPLVKNVRHRPVLTIIHHLVKAAGMLAAAGADLRSSGSGGRR